MGTLWILLGVCVGLGGCVRAPRLTPSSSVHKASVQKHKVTTAPIHLPSRIVHSREGRTIVSPSVWNQETLSFSEGMPQTVNVKPGDSVYTVSRRYGVPIPNIINTNRLHPPYPLKPGQKLILVSPRIHIVQKGEDAYQIAHQHRVSPSRLVAQNGLESHPLKVGQMIVLPPPPTPSVVESSLVKRDSLPPKVRSPTSRTIPLRSSRGFIRPTSGPIVMSFGRQSHGVYCDGINIRIAEGTRIKAADHGVVAYVGNNIKSYGNLVLVRHAGGWVTAYAHLKTMIVRRGEIVRQGQSIGLGGATGYVNGPQLHFEMRKNGKPIKPKFND